MSSPEAVIGPDAQQPRITNDAFISYSRKDEQIAAAIQKALQSYKPPKGLQLPQRYLTVFRDKEDFTGVEYHGSLKGHLQRSAKMLLICSPNACKSGPVNDEIRQFARLKGASNIIPVLAAGVPNNEAKKDQEGEQCFPQALIEVLGSDAVPLGNADYRGFRPGKDKINKGVYYASWYTLLAQIYDIPRSVIEQREKKRQTRKRRITIGTAAAIFLALLSLTTYAFVQRNHAEERAAVALSRQLAAQSDKNFNSFPVRSLLLAIESINSTSKKYGYQTPAAEQSLMDAASKAGGVGIGNHEAEVISVAFSPDGTRLASGSLDKTVRVWNMVIDELTTSACATAGRNLTCKEWRQHFGYEPYSKTCPDLPGAPDCK